MRRNANCYIAAIFFLIHALIAFLKVQDNFTSWNLFFFIGNVVIVVALLQMSPILTGTGAGVCCMGQLIYVVHYYIKVVSQVSTIEYMTYDVYKWRIYGFIAALLILLYWVLLSCGGFNQKNIKNFGTVAGSIGLLHFSFVVYTYLFTLDAFFFVSSEGISGWFNIFLMIFSPFLLASAFKGIPTNAAIAYQSETAPVSEESISYENQIENLTKLKDLLDKGIISQSEFDAKKKEILKI